MGEGEFSAATKPYYLAVNTVSGFESPLVVNFIEVIAL